MGEDAGTGRTSVNDSQDPEQIRAEIEETRRELGETVAALSAKTDVKTQAQAKVEEVKASVSEKRDELRDRSEELLGRAKEMSPDTALHAAQQGSVKAKENPVPVAAIGAFVLGFLSGRLTKR
jgi:chromosome segregation ATPase